MALEIAILLLGIATLILLYEVVVLSKRQLRLARALKKLTDYTTTLDDTYRTTTRDTAGLLQRIVGAITRSRSG